MLSNAPRVEAAGGSEVFSRKSAVTSPNFAEPKPTEPFGATEAEIVAATVLTVQGVVKLHSGWVEEVATYLPGRRVQGVRRVESAWDIHVVAGPLGAGDHIAAKILSPYSLAGEHISLPELADRIRRKLRIITDDPINVTIEEVVSSEESSITKEGQ
ncbi:MAG: hypothetical protein ACRCTR_02640 [Actinomycetota bacterium]